MEPQNMNKPLKINQKSMPERGRKKGCQNDGKRCQNGPPRGANMMKNIENTCNNYAEF